MSQPLQYTFMSLNESYINKAARCLGETFVGVQKGEYVITEPVIAATKLTIDEFTEICRLYLESTYEQGFHFIAVDTATDEVVGVIGTDVFDPSHVDAPYEGNLEVMNRAIDLLEPLDVRLIEKFEHVMRRPVQCGDLLHGFLIGVQTPNNKRAVSRKLVELVLQKGKAQGVSGFFVEATNPRSQGLIKQEFGGYVPTDVHGHTITSAYRDDPFFHVIPPDVAETLEILYIPIDDAIWLY